MKDQRENIIITFEKKMIIDSSQSSVSLIARNHPPNSKSSTSCIRKNLAKLIHVRNSTLSVVFEPDLLVARNRWIAHKVVKWLQSHGRMRGAEHCVGQVTSVREVVHAKVEPKYSVTR